MDVRETEEQISTRGCRLYAGVPRRLVGKGRVVKNAKKKANRKSRHNNKKVCKVLTDGKSSTRQEKAHLANTVMKCVSGAEGKGWRRRKR